MKEYLSYLLWHFKDGYKCLQFFHIYQKLMKFFHTCILKIISTRSKDLGYLYYNILYNDFWTLFGKQFTLDSQRWTFKYEKLLLLEQKVAMATEGKGNMLMT